jgi:hypothetical protein
MSNFGVSTAISWKNVGGNRVGGGIGGLDLSAEKGGYEENQQE